MSSSFRQKPPTSGASEADIAANRALLHYSEASRLAKSWLSDFTSTSGQDDHETEREDEAERELLKKQDLFSDTGGIGYHAPESLNRSTTSVTDPTTTFLRRQLLSGRTGVQNGLKGHNTTAPRPRYTVQRSTQRDQDSDEEESRATVGKKRGRSTGKNTKIAIPLDQTKTAELNGEVATNPLTRSEVASQGDGPESAPQPSTSAGQSNPAKKRGTSSYLDELLASRAAKKQKKKKTRGNAG